MQRGLTERGWQTMTTTRTMNNATPVKRMAYNFLQVNDQETEIEIYDYIANERSFDFWTGAEGNEVTPNSFKEQLNAVSTPNITIRMNSGGGEVFAANTIAVAIQDAVNAGKNIVCKIDGVCASAAVQIALSCKEVIIHKSALMMIHNPAVFLYGYYDANEISKEENMLKATKDSIINAYTEKTGLTAQKLSNMMDAETWLDGKEAVEKGFADRLMFDTESGAVDVYNNIRNAVQNTALNLPQEYRTAINKIIIDENKGGEPEMEIKTVQDLKNQFPSLVDELVNSVKDQARDEGVMAERERIKAIDAMSGRVVPEMLNKAKYETFDKAEKVALDAISNGGLINTGVLNAMMGETAKANEVKGLNNEGNGGEAVNKKANTTAKAASIASNFYKSIGKAE